ncbi:LuxR C-terminal-related transcriptional regulator [Tenggerimyces flavus]|uniref:LuxR C-terminal-related transcriptional regulator n=2 Tax=Tenggerimyces flavus TaxID=1708749 RepID=A0ABV7YHR9_9ACTN
MNLPVQLTSFIGRASDLAAVDKLLATARLVTLTGPGGAGKTRLALEAASAHTALFADDVWFVDLSLLAPDDSVAEAVGGAVGVPVQPLGSLVAGLTGRRVLLCLDNAEHLIDAVASLAAELLRSCPDLTLLVTSREPLRVPGEVVWRVPPLEDDDAVQLFVDRAMHVQPSFVLDPDSEAAVRKIVVHLDGIPLALELAAAWLGSLTPQQILSGLDDRFRLLVRGPRGAQRRQQTLAGSIGWSHALLDEGDRVLFRRLAVFAGSFGLDAVAELSLPAIGRLVDKSLVMTERHGDAIRYRLLETIRAYAAARLLESGEDAAVRDAHVAWCVRFAESAEAVLEQDLDAWQALILPEHANLRAALEWGLAAADPTDGRRLAAALPWMWHLDRLGREGIGYLRRAVSRAPADHSLTQARLLTGIALVADTAAPLDLEYDAATRALELATELGDEGLRALCLTLAAVGRFYTDFDAAWSLCEVASEAAKASGNSFVLGASPALQAIVLHLRDRHVEAASVTEAALPILLRRHRGVASTLLSYRALGSLYAGSVGDARDLALSALRLAEPLGDYLRIGGARSTLAMIQGLTGDVEGALATVDPDLRLVDESGASPWVPGLARTMGVLSLLGGDPLAAVGWFSREAGSTDGGSPTWLAAHALPGLAAALLALDRLDEAAATVSRALELADHFDLPFVRAAALDVRGALVARSPDQLGVALDLHHAALAERVDHGLRAFLPVSLEAIASVASVLRPAPDDVRTLAAASAASMLPRPAFAQTAFDQTCARLRAALGDEAYEEAWSDGSTMSLDEAVALCRRTRGTRGRPTSGWASLTPTELDVARLVAEGLNNPAIAARLFMSRGTVKAHLAHIFAKLEITNRTELATLATRRPT